MDAGANAIDLKLLESVYQLDVNGVRNAIATGTDSNNSFNIIDISSSSMVEFAMLNTKLSFVREEAPKCCLDILNLLFDAGAMTGKESLYDAIFLESPAIVQLLLENGANPNKPIRGLTPVEWAEKRGENKIVCTIIKYGGKPISVQEAAQLRLLHVAKEHNIVEMEKALNNGAQVNEGYKGIKINALKCALEFPTYEYERYAAITYLLQKGANSNLRGPTTAQGISETPLHTAMFMTSLSFRREDGGNVYAMLVIEALLKAGADVSARDESDKNPLHIAAKYNNVIGAKMLIEAGAKFMDRDKDGKTPLDYAESAEMIKLLKSHGAKEE